MKPSELIKALPKDSWFRKWVAVWPHAEPPTSYLLFGAMAVFSACVGRRTYIDQDVHQLWPMFNLLLIGPSGIGKSTAIDITKGLTEGLDEGAPTIIQGATTPEELHQTLRLQPKAILRASELAAFFGKQKYMEGLVPYTTELLDYKEVQERRTRRDGLVTVQAPTVTVIGGSTLEWLQEQLPDSATTGGFLARFFIVEEKHKRQRVANPADVMTPTQRARLLKRRSECVQEFQSLVEAVQPSTMKFKDYTVQDVYSVWYHTHVPMSGFLAPFAARAGTFILRLAMLIALSCKRMQIQKQDMRAAITMYEYMASKLLNVVVPFTVKGKLMQKIVEAVGAQGISKRGLYRSMKNFITVNEVNSLVDSLKQAGELTETEVGRIVRTVS